MSDLPQRLPGARESDADLGLDALELIRKQIADHIDATQGAWARSPLWLRGLPLALGVACAAVWAGIALTSGAVGLAAALGWAAALAAFLAVGRAPLHPSQAERAAQVALAAGAVALAVEAGFIWTGHPMPGGDDLHCMRGVVLGALAPSALLALYVRRSQAPARLWHVAALGGAAFLSSASAVWAECPSTDLRHVCLAHVGTPLLAAAVVVAIVRPLLRGKPVAR